MFEFWKTWIEASRFALDAQTVVALRLMRLAAGDARAAAEAQRMVAEKVAAFAAAQIAGGTALATGASLAVARKRAAAPIQRSVRANRRRLTRKRR